MQKKQGSKGVLTEARNGRERGAGEAVGDARRQDVAELGKRVEAGARWAPRLLGSARGAPVAAVEGSTRPEHNRRRAIARRFAHLRRVLARNPTRAGAGVGECELGGVPGVDVGLLRGSGVLGWGDVAEQRRRRGSARRRRAAG